MGILNQIAQQLGIPQLAFSAGCAGYLGHPFSNKPIFACFHHNTTKKGDMK
jgi:hypothetical protein